MMMTTLMVVMMTTSMVLVLVAAVVVVYYYHYDSVVMSNVPSTMTSYDKKIVSFANSDSEICGDAKDCKI